MNDIEKLIDQYPAKGYVIAATKDSVLLELENLRKLIMRMDDFTEFPEGSMGALIYSLLRQASFSCPDAGDFNYMYQGFQTVLEESYKTISKDSFN